MVITFVKVVSPMKILSCAYWRRFTNTFCSTTRKLEKRFFLMTSLIIVHNSSRTMLNKKGVNGYPCLSPLDTENSKVRFWFTNINILLLTKHHLIHFSSKPNLYMKHIYKKKISTYWNMFFHSLIWKSSIFCFNLFASSTA